MRRRYKTGIGSSSALPEAAWPPPASTKTHEKRPAPLTGLLLLALAAALLVAGAELFVENAAAAARRLGVTVFAVGLLLAGAEPEELLTAIVAAVQGHPSLAAGDAVGANITMLTATLGLAALARPLPFGRRVRSYAAVSAAAGLLALAALADGRVSRFEGALLLLGYAALVGGVWRAERQPPALGELAELEEAMTGEPGTGEPGTGEPGTGEPGTGEPGTGEPGAREATTGKPGTGEHRTGEDGKPARPPLAGLLLALAGVGIMLLGGNAAVAGATRVVAALGQTDTAIGLTLLALVTTAELFALVWSAARRGVSEIAVAGVVGSAAYNATATLGAAALVRPLSVSGLTGPAAVAAGLPLAVVALAWRGQQLGRFAGVLLCAGYAAFVVATFR